MKRLLYIIKNILICICIGLVAGFFIMAGVWVFSEDKPTADRCLEILRISAAVGAFAAALVRLVITAAEQHPVNKALSLARYDDTAPKAFDIMKKKIASAKDSEKLNTYRLILSALYTENGRTSDAREELKSIDFTALPDELAQEYFNASLYTYLLERNMENAEKVLTDAEPYFKDPAPSVLHTLGVYEYAKGNYGKARSYLYQSRSHDDSDRNTCDCDLYLALCALKEGKLDEAKALRYEASATLVTSQEDRDLRKLERLIEIIEKGSEETTEPEMTEDTEEQTDISQTDSEETAQA